MQRLRTLRNVFTVLATAVLLPVPVAQAQITLVGEISRIAPTPIFVFFLNLS